MNILNYVVLAGKFSIFFLKERKNGVQMIWEVERMPGRMLTLRADWHSVTSSSGLFSFTMEGGKKPQKYGLETSH